MKSFIEDCKSPFVVKALRLGVYIDCCLFQVWAIFF